jgi:hypothetical protein
MERLREATSRYSWIVLYKHKVFGPSERLISAHAIYAAVVVRRGESCSHINPVVIGRASRVDDKQLVSGRSRRQSEFAYARVVAALACDDWVRRVAYATGGGEIVARRKRRYARVADSLEWNLVRRIRVGRDWLKQWGIRFARSVYGKLYSSPKPLLLRL